MRRPAALLLLAVIQSAGPGPAVAQATSASFSVTWSGFEVGLVELRLDADAVAYRLSWQGRTVGWLGALFPFAADGVAAGRIDGTEYRPASFSGRSTSRSGTRAWHVAFDTHGRAALVETSGDDLADRDPVPGELQVAPDPASLALTATLRAGPGLNLAARSFDGRRAAGYDLACAEAPPAELACTISTRMLAGASRRWRERAASEAGSEPIRVWLRRGEDGRHWPVRLEISSRFGTVLARRLSLATSPEAG